MTTYPKDADAVLDWKVEWSDWLGSGEEIDTYEVDVATGLTKDSDSATASAVTVWLSGGTAGTRYTVACRITTSAGRTDERTFMVSVRER